jgi:hypothetical protein
VVGSDQALPKISLLFLNEASRVHRIGPRMMIAQTISAIWPSSARTPVSERRRFGTGGATTRRAAVVGVGVLRVLMVMVGSP